MNEKNKYYSPMEEILIRGAQAFTAKEAEAALETKKKTNSLLELDEMLLKMEAQADMMDGIKLEEWVL